MTAQPILTDAASAAVHVRNLTFNFGGPAPLDILKDVSLDIPRGSRCLLVGANGAGKSTLLRILAGKRLVKTAGVNVLGKNPFYDGSQNITYLGTEWAQNPIVRRDVPVFQLLQTLGAERYPERCSQLLDIMDVDPNWHMHEVSDGQRRRVQIVLGLMEPWDLLLLDEVTVDLDVLVRSALLNFLREETESRNATILYATHIFDYLSGWSTHVAHMAAGAVREVRDVNSPEGFPELAEMEGRKDNSALLLVVEKWLRDDLARARKEAPAHPTEGRPMTRWDVLSENMRENGDKYFNYWTGQ
ncbi:CCR4-NOT regulatory complex component [Thoreauomyces humboldtii]|nr:CCR4-NOT regulatory complex component [Thoreauomyces humboldtii]